MKKFAQVKNNKVVNVFDWNSNTKEPIIEGLIHVDITNLSEKPRHGWEYISGNFIKPAEPIIIPNPIRKISLFDFRMRFTLDERILMDNSKDEKTITLVNDLKYSKIIDLDNPLIGQILDYFIIKGLMSSGRKTEILS